VAISQPLSYTLLAVPSGCSTAFKSIPQRQSAKMWQFPFLFSEGLRFCLHFLKFKGAFENIKNHQWLLS
jgi:hypothetical protein